MFRRRKAGSPDTPDADPAGVGSALADAPDDVMSEVPAPTPSPASGEGTTYDRTRHADGGEGGYDRSAGPFDIDELGGEESRDPDATEVARLDLGGLRVPAHEGMELRLDVDEASGQVVSVTVVAGASAVQLSVFAAPRLDGIWADVRRDIAGGIGAGGGTVDEIVGTLGTELRAALPSEPGSGGPRGLVPVRFVGVDGPRWFLRGLFTGPAARDTAAAAPLESVLRGCVVVRGTDPMAPGDVLLLQVPTELPAGLARGGEDEQAEPGSGQRPALAAPERGPEITEIR